MFYKMLGLFMYILAGFIVRKRGILKEEHTKGLSIFLMDLALPALVITSLQMPFSKAQFTNGIKVLGIGFLSYIVMGIVAYLVIKIFKVKKDRKNIVIFMLLFANTGYMGYPVVMSIFGKSGLFDAVLLNAWFTVFLWTAGIMLLSGNKNGFKIKNLINPGTVSLIIGFSLFMLDFQISNIIFEPLKMLGDTTIPIAMCLVGVLLGETSIIKVFKSKLLLMVSFFRLIGIPFIFMLVIWMFKLERQTFEVAVLITAMPVAANTAIFSRRFDLDYTFASEGILITTVLSLLTIPVWTYILPLIY